MIVGIPILLLCSFIIVGLPLYVFPANDSATRADVVFVIGPPTERRLALAQDYLDSRATEELLIIGHYGGDGPFEIKNMPICRAAHVTCDSPYPSTTKGEVSVLEQYVEGREIEDVIVITFTPHVTRTQFIFEKCYTGGGDVSVVGVGEEMTFDDWAYQYAYQSAAFAKAWATDCSGGEAATVPR